MVVPLLHPCDFALCVDDSLKDVRLLRVNIDRALIFGYDLHEYFMQLILKFGQYSQHSLFITNCENDCFNTSSYGRRLPRGEYF